jgi:hypothetical protein
MCSPFVQYRLSLIVDDSGEELKRPDLNSDAVANAPAAPVRENDVRLEAEDLPLLLQLSDPEAPAPAAAVEPTRLARLLAAADRHGVLAIVFRKCREAAAPAQVALVLDPYRPRVVGAVGQAMLLERTAQKLVQKFADDGVRATIVKGPVFADRLYRHRSDRPFTDIDFLVAPDSLDAANAAIEFLGFDRPTKTWDNSHRNREYKWLSRENPSILVELHGDLVHYPALRRRISFGYDRLLEAGNGVPDSPPALLMTAVVHAACGHKFHELGLLVDVLQAVRRLKGEDEQVVEACRAMGAALEVAVTLHLVGELFHEPRAAKLAVRVGDHRAIRLGRHLIDAQAIFGPDCGNPTGAWWRRHGFRLLQQIGPLRP